MLRCIKNPELNNKNEEQSQWYNKRLSDLNKKDSDVGT